MTKNTGTGACARPSSGAASSAALSWFATRKLVGWAMADNYRTPLISEAIRMAARNLDLPEGAVFHSDRGSNYTSAEFAGVLKALSITQSVGRTGICFDNAISESWNGTLKTELVHLKDYAIRKAPIDDNALSI